MTKSIDLSSSPENFTLGSETADPHPGEGVMNESKFYQLANYSCHGYPIFSIHWIEGGSCSCGSILYKNPGKHPLIAHGSKAVTIDRNQIRLWHEKWPCAYWRMRTRDIGAGGSRIRMVACDPKTGGLDYWEVLCAEYPLLIVTVSVLTGDGGQDFWFHFPTGMDFRSGSAALGPGFDVHANGSYVLVLPSFAIQDHHFKHNPSAYPIGVSPKWILDRVNESPKSSQKPSGFRASHGTHQ